MTLFLIVAFCPVASAANNRKLDFLVQFFDLNEAAFAYYRHCDSKKKGINENFMRALEYVANELFIAEVKNNSNVTPEYIKGRILERRYKIQSKLDLVNQKEGCNTPDSQLAKKHYEDLSRFSKSDVRKFIETHTANP